MSLFSVTSSVEPQFFAASVAPHVQQDTFSLVLITPDTDIRIKETALKALRHSMRDWIEIVQDRKRAAERDFAGRRDYQDIVSEEQDSVVDYKGIVMRLSIELLSPESTFLLLTDREQRIQAVVALSELVDEIYVNVLLSAAWNIPMHGENPLEHQMVAVKGAGTSAMRQVYEFAKLKKKSKVTLHAIKSSERFYQEKLKMQTSGSPKYFFEVSSTSIPESLRQSDNLLLQIIKLSGMS